MLQADLAFRKRMPRILLNESVRVLNGIDIQWSKTEHSSLLNLSYSGVYAQTGGFLSRFKLGQSYDFNLRLTSSQQLLPVRMKLIQLDSGSLGFVFSESEISGRLQIDQISKDHLIQNNFIQNQIATVSEQNTQNIWWNAPFDTNILIWKINNQIVQAIIEYDYMMLKFENGKWQIRRTSAVADQIKGYFAPYNEIKVGAQRVSLGATWFDRMTKVIAPLVFQEPLLPEIFSNLDLT